MSVLSDTDIRKGHIQGSARGGFELDPYDPERVQPASYDVELGNSFRYFKRSKHVCIDPRNLQPELTGVTDVHGDGVFILHPGDFALGMTGEKITLSDMLVARVEGKSSLGRLGLVVHSTAGWIDPGFSGVITLELSNNSPLPIKLYPGMLIAQIAFMSLSSRCFEPYGSDGLGSKYQGDSGPAESRYQG